MTQVVPRAAQRSAEVAVEIVIPALDETSSPFSGAIGIQQVAAPARRHIPDTDLWVFPLALGAQRFGRTVDPRTAVDMLDRYREGGGNLIDTVDAVVAQRSEQLIGAWLRARRCRDDIVLATTVGGGTDFPGLTPANIVAGVDASLQRLGVDRLDLLFMRESEGVPVPLEESLGAIDALVHAGKVGYIAASGLLGRQAHRGSCALAANGLPRFRAVQSSVQPRRARTVRGFRLGVGERPRPRGVPVEPAEPRCARRLHPRRRVHSRQCRESLALHLNRRLRRIRSVVDRIATEHGVPSATIAIAWLLARRDVVAPVTGARSISELQSLMAAPRVTLTRSDMLDLDRVTL